MNVTKINFGNSRAVKINQLKKVSKTQIPANNKTFQEIIGYGKPQQGKISGFESLNAIYDKIKRGENLSGFERLYYSEMCMAIASSFAQNDYEDVFGPLTWKKIFTAYNNRKIYTL